MPFRDLEGHVRRIGGKDMKDNRQQGKCKFAGKDLVDNETEKLLSSLLHAGDEPGDGMHGGIHGDMHVRMDGDMRGGMHGDMDRGTYGSTHGGMHGDMDSGMGSGMDAGMHSGMYGDMDRGTHGGMHGDMGSSMDADKFVRVIQPQIIRKCALLKERSIKKKDVLIMLSAYLLFLLTMPFAVFHYIVNGLNGTALHALLVIAGICGAILVCIPFFLEFAAKKERSVKCK
jgi:hypothetical protein